MGDYRVCSAGEHRARALSAALSTAKNGMQYIEIIFALSEGGQISWSGWFGDDAKKNAWSIEALRNCGWSGDDLTDMTGVDRNQVMLKIEDEEYNGNLRSKVKYVNKLGVTAQHRNPMTPIEARQLADRLKPLCQSVTGAPKSRSPAVQPQTYVSRSKGAYRANPEPAQRRPGNGQPQAGQPWLPNPFEDGNQTDDDIPF